MDTKRTTAAQAALNKYIRLFQSRFPSGRILSDFLSEAGCSVIWAEEVNWDQEGHAPWRLHFRLPDEFEAEFGFSRELMLLATTWREFQGRSLEFLRSAVEGDGRVDPEVVFIFCHDQSVSEKASEWCGNDFIVVGLTPASIKMPPRETLRKALQSNFYGRNFYDEAGVVTGDRFFGRLNLLRKLTADIASGRPVGLFGLRRIGKTSLLRQLGETLDTSSHCYIYIDLQGSRLSSDARHVLLVAARELNKQLGEEFIDPNVLEAGWSTDRGALAQAILDKLGDLSSLRGRKIVLALDELEVLLPTAASPGMAYWDKVLAGLRSLDQTNAPFSLILAGASPHVLEIRRIRDRDNPVFQYGQPTYIGCMSDREFERMVIQLGKRTGMFWAEGTLSRLYSATGGHPFLTRLVCSAVVDGLDPPATVDLALLETRITEFLETGVVIFSQVVESLATDYPEELDMLTKIALQSDFRSSRTGATSLAHLLGYSLVERSGGSLKMKIGLLEAWLRAGGI